MEPDEEFWTKKLAEGRQGQLEAVRKAAAMWSALFSAILAAFGTVSFAGGLPELGELHPVLQWPVKIATLLAAGMMVRATILASRASGNFVERSNANSWQSLQRATNAQAETAAAHLTSAKKYGAATAGIALLGTAVIFLAGEATAPAEPAPEVIAVINGAAVCGQLNLAGGRLSVDSKSLTGAVSFLAVVDSCP